MEPQILIFGLFLLGVIEAVIYNDLKSSLTFVIDDTGSMQIDVHELNKTAKSIFETVNSDKSHIDDFVVVTFNDPEIKLRNNAHNRSDFENALSVIEPHGGGNCAEMSLSGIQMALDNSRPGSLLWVFTDASAVDMEKYYKVEELSQKMGNQVYFAITGLCDNRTNPDFLVYRDLAVATNGQVFHLRKNEIGRLFKYVESLIEDRKDIVLSKTFPAGGQHIIDVNVDTDMKELIIAVSGENPVVTVRDPSGLAVATTEVTRLSEIAIVTVDVNSGVYKLEVVSTSETHIVVSAPTSVNFQHGFSIFASSNIYGTTRKPVPGKQSYLSILLATVDPKDFEVRSAQILDMDDQVLLEEPLKLVNKTLQFYTTEKITPPDHMFKVAVKLYDVRSKTNLTRHGLTPIKPQNETTGDKTLEALVVTIVGGPKINAAYYQPLQLTCKIKGYPTPSVFWKSSDISANLTYDKHVSIFEMPDDYISVLDITEVKNNATYTCEAMNYKHIKNNSVTVQTQVIKVFNIKDVPENATIDYQQPGRIACEVKAFPVAKVSWYKNGELLKPDGNLQVSKNGSILTIRSMELYIADSYKCSVENALDKKVFPFKLSISGLEKPIINKTNPNITAMINSKTDLKCEVTAGVPTPVIHWSYKEVAATDYTDLNTTSHTINFNTVNASNAGTYFCLAVNAAGSDFLELQLDVKDKCQIRKDAGTCTGSHTKWYYDSDLKKCRTFTYGGCQGNENNFPSKTACHAACVPVPTPEAEKNIEHITPVAETITPVPEMTTTNIGKCQQPMEVGPCKAAFRKWYYDSGLKACRTFIYGGCNKNENNFNSEETCRAECVPTPPVTVTTPPDIVTTPPVIVTTPAPIGKCQQPMEVGPCQAAFRKWYYDSGLKACRTFIYGGCNANENNFNSEAECRAECPSTPPDIATTPPVIVTTPAPLGKCQQPMEVGPCQAAFRKWYYDSGLKACRIFIYGGCNKNENNFNSEEACRAECAPTSPFIVTTPAPLGKCQQPMEVGPCQAAFRKWYYDSGLKACRTFIYGGCNANENNFNSEAECRAECPSTPPDIATTPPVIVTTPAPLGKCQQPMEVGPCQAAFRKWYYDSGLKACRTFIYGGCNANENNFNSEAECRAECPSTPPDIATTPPVIVTTPAPLGKCQQPMEVGPCQAAFRKWYYDSGLKACRTFIYGGCNANENNFNSEAECRAECPSTPPDIATTPPVIVTTPAPLGKCEQPMEVGPCQAAFRKWYYDSGLKACRTFIYGGCNANENNFNSEAECRAECPSTPPDIATTPPVIVTTPAPLGKCQQPMEVGPCQAAFRKWYYDSGLKACRTFIYGGCNANENNFNSEAECRAECPSTPPDIATTPPVIVTTPAPLGKCQQPMEVGPCRAAFRKWYYDSGLKACRMFIYGGCNANENNFNSEAACRAECASTSPDKVTTPPVIVTTPPVIVTIPPVIVTAPAPTGCFLDLKKDLNGNDPLMLTQNDEFTNFETGKGHLLIPKNETIKLVCPVKFSKIVLKEIIVTCESEKHFRLQSSGTSYPYFDLKCTDQWQYKTMRTGRQCSNTDSELLNVGFEIRGRFQEVYKICLNQLTNNPIYTKLNLEQSLPNAIADKNTPWFNNEDSVDLDAAYDCETQNEAISRILNKEFQNNNRCCFAKRMLVNPLDVAAGLPQAATYSYLNVAPHWSNCNSQNWEEIEQRIRDLRRKSGRTLEVWTGVAQHLQIRDARSNLKNVTLSQSGKEFQVPTYFWKVVHDSVSKTALAIIQVNVPDLKIKDGRKHLLCTDVCKKTEWMKSAHWRNVGLGYTYCCSLDEFKSAFQLAYYGVLPTSHKLLLDVTNLPNDVV